ncbi:MAG TPA: isoprenylcysteine carboxylmethyltransferase family protein [Bacteroidales bacterium]|nr:isoprenylcysteine carboxylmethyltransferase family protein [Bacteroidales bacterium]
MDLIGKTSINPVLFYTGKISGYITWIIFALQHTDKYYFKLEGIQYNSQIYFSYILAGLAIVLITISLYNLGKSTRLGLPKTDTKLKINGLYKISRNPMYLGFNLLTISSMIYTLNFVIIIMGLYSIFVYHWIIKAEERFLEQRFGDDFIKYKSITRRYI